MQVHELDIPDVKVFSPNRFEDPRGFFSETYKKATFDEHGLAINFVQDNVSVSTQKGTVRGLHFQIPPWDQDKLVMVPQGSILDVAVDIRRDSNTYGQYVCAEISAERWNQILVPKGFAHGFCTLEANTTVMYKVSNYYSPDHDRGILWCDEDLCIKWPVSVANALVSEKDQHLPGIAELKSQFTI
ncbi:MAG: dTDP-4-dehydrorhamnose 3,5-epimerase [Gammaproteobacteria bacterium]